MIDNTRGIVHIGEIIGLVMDGYEDVMKRGILAGEPCVKMKVRLMDCSLHEDAIHRGPSQMLPAVRDGIKLAFMTAAPTLFEPVQTHLIEAPVENTGDVSKLVMNKRGNIIEMNQEGAHSFIKAKLPVSEMLGWSSDLRSATAGRGSSSLMDQTFERVPTELQERVIKQIRERKGLTEGQVGA